MQVASFKTVTGRAVKKVLGGDAGGASTPAAGAKKTGSTPAATATGTPGKKRKAKTEDDDAATPVKKGRAVRVPKKGKKAKMVSAGADEDVPEGKFCDFLLFGF